MSRATRIAAIGDDFPAVQVQVDDMLEWRYAVDGRGSSGIDCLGVVLEVYRRAGIELPDPRWPGESEESFADLFEPATGDAQIFDVAFFDRQGLAHVLVLVAPGSYLTAKVGVGVCRHRANLLRLAESVRFFRLKASALP